MHCIERVWNFLLNVLLSSQLHFFFKTWNGFLKGNLSLQGGPERFFSLHIARGSHLSITYSKSLQLSFVTWRKIRKFPVLMQAIFTFKMSHFLFHFTQKHSYCRRRLIEQMCSFSTSSDALTDFPSGPSWIIPSTTAASSYGHRAMHQHFWQLNCLAQQHDNGQYGDKVLKQPFSPKKILCSPPRCTDQGKNCHCLLTAKKVASNGLWKGQQNQWICQEGKHRLSWVFNQLAVEPSVRARLVCAPERRRRREKGQLCPWDFKQTMMLNLDFIREIGLEKDFGFLNFLLKVFSYPQLPLQSLI